MFFNSFSRSLWYFAQNCALTCDALGNLRFILSLDPTYFTSYFFVSLVLYHSESLSLNPAFKLKLIKTIYSMIPHRMAANTDLGVYVFYAILLNWLQSTRNIYWAILLPFSYSQSFTFRCWFFFSVVPISSKTLPFGNRLDWLILGSQEPYAGSHSNVNNLLAKKITTTTTRK